MTIMYTDSMKKEQIALTILCLAAIIGVGLFFVLSPLPASKPITYAEAERQARGQKTLPRCLESHSQNIPGVSREDITKVVGAKLTELPPGMAYGVYIKSYEKQQATGTIIYDGISNAFNFSAQSHNGGWKITDFHACEVQ